MSAGGNVRRGSKRRAKNVKGDVRNASFSFIPDEL